MGRYWPRLRRLDGLTLGYFAIVSTLIIIFHDRVPRWYQFPIGFLLGAAAIVVLAAVHERHPANGLVMLARYAYPLAFSIVLYGSVDRYVLVLRGHFLDAGMNAWELAAFGAHPNVVIDRLASPPLTEVLYACYFGFYLLFVIPPFLLYRARREADLQRYVFALMSALYTCYLGFLIVPLVGPGTSLAGQFHPATLTGYVIVPVQKFIMAKGDPAGACFPSAHVAGAWTALFAVRALFGPKAFRWMLPATAGLTVAVVYTRYHYLSDALAGLAVAAVVFPLVAAHGWRIAGAWSGRSREPGARFQPASDPGPPPDPDPAGIGYPRRIRPVAVPGEADVT